MMSVPHRKHISSPPRPIPRIAFLFICRWCSYLTGNTYFPPRPIPWIVLLCYMLMMSVPHRKHISSPPRPIPRIALLFTCRWCSYLTWNTPASLHGLFRGELYLLFTHNTELSAHSMPYRKLYWRCNVCCVSLYNVCRKYISFWNYSAGYTRDGCKRVLIIIWHVPSECQTLIKCRKHQYILVNSSTNSTDLGLFWEAAQ
jgi:hypothetical protein